MSDKIPRHDSFNSFDEEEHELDICHPVNKVCSFDANLPSKVTLTNSDMSKPNQQFSIKPNRMPFCQQGNNKCSRVVLATTSTCSIDGFQRTTCTNLICSDCNIIVQSLPNREWLSTCDYLFFRTNFGLPSQLLLNSKPSTNTTAYYCGCRGITIITPQFSDNIPNLRWGCMGHFIPF